MSRYSCRRTVCAHARLDLGPVPPTRTSMCWNKVASLPSRLHTATALTWQPGVRDQMGKWVVVRGRGVCGHKKGPSADKHHHRVSKCKRVECVPPGCWVCFWQIFPFCFERISQHHVLASLAHSTASLNLASRGQSSTTRVYGNPDFSM